MRWGALPGEAGSGAGGRGGAGGLLGSSGVRGGGTGRALGWELALRTLPLPLLMRGPGRQGGRETGMDRDTVSIGTVTNVLALYSSTLDLK